MNSKFRSVLANALLVVLSTLLGYVAIEYAFFRVILPNYPLSIRPQLPSIADVLSQNSKSGYVPHDYIALLGDSYAEGLGDWLLQAGGDRTKPFHSANVIHEATGRDVVTFGKGGAGSAEGIVLRTARTFALSRCSMFPTIEQPRQFFIYYYEGNDVTDNIGLIIKVQSQFGSFDTAAIDRYLAEHYEHMPAWQCHFELIETAARMAAFLYRYYVGGLMIPYCGELTPKTNRITVGGQTMTAPAFQGPATWLDDHWIRVSMTVLERSLAWLRGQFPEVPVTVVYIPSPLATYAHADDSLTWCHAPTEVGSTSASEVARHHDLVRELVARTSAEKGADFLDATPAIRAAAAEKYIHGTRDRDHLNETGYRVLGGFVAAHVR
jgi:hypothetical protein